MKKIFFVLVVLLSINSFSQENQFNIGINGGITTGDIKPISSAAFGIDANYLFKVFDGISLGPSLNFLYFLTDEVNGVQPDAFVYLPIGGAIRFQSLSDYFYVGLDLGFAIGISPSGDNGGLFFKPMVGYNVTENLKLNLFYSAVKKRQPAYSYVGLGIAFDIFGSNQYSY